LSSETSIERRLTTVEVKVKEHGSDIKQVRKDLHRAEDNLRADIKGNHDLIVRILDNEIPHLTQCIERANGSKPYNGKWDLLKLIGAVSGLLSGIALVIANSQVIGEAIHGFLHIFFGG